jgi:hypothetical protein
MGLKEKAEEDIYFAKRDQELIRALHEDDSQVSPDPDAGDTGSEIDDLRDEDDTAAPRKSQSPGNLAKHLRTLFHKMFRRSPDQIER